MKFVPGTYFFSLIIAFALILPALSVADGTGNGYPMSTLRCAACGQPITGRYITALGKTWHPEHFVCAECGRPFAGDSGLTLYLEGG